MDSQIDGGTVKLEPEQQLADQPGGCTNCPICNGLFPPDVVAKHATTCNGVVPDGVPAGEPIANEGGHPLEGWVDPESGKVFNFPAPPSASSPSSRSGVGGSGGFGNYPTSSPHGSRCSVPPVSPLFPTFPSDFQISQIPPPPVRVSADGCVLTPSPANLNYGVSMVTGRSKRSAVWDHYELLVDEGKFGATVAKCLHCDQQIKGSHGATSNFRTHLISKHSTRKRYACEIPFLADSSSADYNAAPFSEGGSGSIFPPNSAISTSPSALGPTWDSFMAGSRKLWGTLAGTEIPHQGAPLPMAPAGPTTGGGLNQMFERGGGGGGWINGEDINRMPVGGADRVLLGSGEDAPSTSAGEYLASIGGAKRFRPEALQLEDSSPPAPRRVPSPQFPGPTTTSAPPGNPKPSTSNGVYSPWLTRKPTGKLPTCSPTTSNRAGGGGNLVTLDGPPLADQMRPRTFSEFFGQPNVTGDKSVIKKLLVTGQIPSMIFWGPPGCGKTTLGRIIAAQCKTRGPTTAGGGGAAHRFVQLSAPSSSVAEVKQKLESAANELKLRKCRTIMFMDEIHRFNKLQQDTFLSHVEKGTVTLIGATTENPSFSLNAALLSRCRVITLDKLDVESVRRIAQRACDRLNVAICQPTSPTLGGVNNATRRHVTNAVMTSHSAGVVNGDVGDGAIVGRELDWANATFEEHNGDDSNASGDLFAEADDSDLLLLDEESEDGPLSIDADALDLLVGFSDGDARIALNTLQMALQSVINLPNRKVDCDIVKNSLQRSHLVYDRKGDQHFDTISALHKSIRGSDPNAALYWLARMLEGGEDPRFVARRLIRMAVEDIGLADPRALEQATAAYHAVIYVGMPECDLALAQAAVYLARSPKSVDIYMAYSAAKDSIKAWQGPLPPIPLHLRNAPTKMMREMGYGDGYKYNPAYREPVTDQSYLPPEMESLNFFTEGERKLREKR